MAANKPHELIIGLDFGTTYSGVSWVVNHGKAAVQLINEWPNAPNCPGNRESQKVPTLISYHDEGKRWGFNADMDNTIRCFKMALDKPTTHMRLLGKMGDYMDDGGRSEGANAKYRPGNSQIKFDAEQLTVDYLGEMWAFTMEHMQKCVGPEWSKLYSLKVVLGVPTMWTPETRGRFHKIASEAGLPDDLHIISEPEAAAIAVFQDVMDRGSISFKEGDILTVCDAGGGTVDLISYRILGLDPLSLEECVEGSGDLCGSAIIDASFENHVKKLVGEDDYYQIPKGNRIQMMEDFDYYIKRPFSFEDMSEVSAELKGVKDNLALGISDERITINRSDLCKLFDDVCSEVVKLVRDQISAVEAKGDKVKAVLLVGGFGDNKYLHHRIQNAKAFKKRRNFAVGTMNPWSSVCRGAAMWGLQHSARNQKPNTQAVQSRVARYSYGIRIPKETMVKIREHSDLDSITTSIDSRVDGDRMVWLVKQGDRLEEGKQQDHRVKNYLPLKWHHFLTGAKKTFTHTLYYSRKDHLPDYFDSHAVTPLCDLSHDVEGVSILRRALQAVGGRDTTNSLRDVWFTLGVRMESASMDFYASYYKGKKKEVARCQARYYDEEV